MENLGVEDALKDDESVGGAEEGIAGTLGVGHEAEHVAALVTDACDVVAGAVWICSVGGVAIGVAVPKEDAVLSAEFLKGGVIRKIAAFAVGDRDVQDLAFGRAGSEARVGRFHAEVLVFADEMESLVADERTGEEACFTENLEAVANTNDSAAGGGELLDSLHDRGESGDRTAAEVVAVGKAAGDNNGIDVS